MATFHMATFHTAMFQRATFLQKVRMETAAKFQMEKVHKEKARWYPEGEFGTLDIVGGLRGRLPVRTLRVMPRRVAPIKKLAV
jgi:hypothetical protein